MKNSFKVFLFLESSRASGRLMLEGIARYAHHHGPWSFYWEPGGLETNPARLKKLDADGIIFRDVAAFKQEAIKLGIPAVVVGHGRREARGLLNVVTDSAAIGRMTAEHLLERGLRHFAFCGYAGTAREQTPWSKHRMESFRRRVVEAGFAPPATYVFPFLGVGWQKTRRELAEWLVRLPKPLGLMACNDDCGVQVIEACKLQGFRVPDTVSVIGVDNDEVVCGLADPPMSSVAIDFERAGYQAAEALDRLMRGSRTPSPKIEVRAVRVVARRSTDIVAVEDKQLVAALTCIRDRARTPLTVNEVARVVGISRRSLERRFRQQLGGSILQAIRRQRADHIAQLLLETSLPVTRIAESLGFPDVQHFARYFRAAKKMSPLAFRKNYGSKVGEIQPGTGPATGG